MSDSNFCKRKTTSKMLTVSQRKHMHSKIKRIHLLPILHLHLSCRRIFFLGDFGNFSHTREMAFPKDCGVLYEFAIFISAAAPNVIIIWHLLLLFLKIYISVF